jgi:DNA polymerase-3 subunit epsilon/ATP-dependent DNA helicase DinG
MEQTGGACPFARACAKAEQAQVLFIDQGLLIADAASNAPILPKTEHLVVVDAHHLEDAATVALSQRHDRDAFTRLLDDIGSLKKGLLADLLRTIEPALSERQRENTTEYIRNLAASVAQMKRLNTAFFDGLSHLLQSENVDQGEFLVQTRLTDKSRTKPEFHEIRAAWEALSEFLREVAAALAKLAERMNALRERLTDPALPDVIASVRAAADHLMAADSLLEGAVSKPDSNTVYWLESGQDQRVPILRTAPLAAGPSAMRALWSRSSTVLVSNTLQAGAGFDYLREQLAVPQGTREAVLPDPADYKHTVLLFLPTDIDEPQSKERYQRSVETALINLSAALDGKTMALFTSTMQMKQTSQNISARLALSGISVVDQSDGSTREALLEGFEGTGKSILFGGKAFWEEIEIAPEALAAVVITKLPFAPPGDAVLGARSELYENSFTDRAVPDAVIKFRQGFNRLHRPQHGQRGVMVVLDKRVISKAYGRTFLDSLPPCTEHRGTISELGTVAKAWIAGEYRATGGQTIR